MKFNSTNFESILGFNNMNYIINFKGIEITTHEKILPQPKSQITFNKY